MELQPDILRQAIAPDYVRHYHRRTQRECVIIVESLGACLKETGEIIQAGVGPEKLVEIGELVMIKKASMRDSAKRGEGEEGLRR